jgi:predicted acylesterase/phospholipase RssA
MLFILAGVIFAQNSKELNVGLALRGGGALGFAHIGALHVIDSLEIPISNIAGTSMGGLIGALYAIGYSSQEMQDFVLNLDWIDIFNDTPSRRQLPFHIKSKSGLYQLEMNFSGYSPSLPSGIVVGQKIYKTFFTITYPFEGINSFDDLPIPFRCLGADLVTGNEIIFSDGSLAKAMRSTMSLPTAFTPVRYDTAMVIDGGMTNNFPVDVAFKMGSDFVIGLNLISTVHDADYYDDLMKIIDRTLDVPRKDKLQQTIDAADLLVQQEISGYSLADFEKTKIMEIIQRGKLAAYAKIEELRSLKKQIDSKNKIGYGQEDRVISEIKVSGDPVFTISRIERILGIKTGRKFSKTYLESRIRKFNNSTHLVQMTANIENNANNGVVLKVNTVVKIMPVLKEVTVVGNENVSEEFILKYLGIVPGMKIDFIEFEHMISMLYGLKYFSAIRYTIDQNDDESISLTLEIVEASFTRFSIGFHYDDFYHLVGAIGFSGTTLWAPGLFYDIYLQFSGLTRFRTNIIYPTRSMDFPVYPLLAGGFTSIPRDVFNTEGKKLLRYDERNWYFGGGIGITPINYLNLSAAIMFEYPNINVDIGDLDLGTDGVNERIAILDANLILDLLDDVLLPKDGLKFELNLELSSTKLLSNFDYKRLESYFDFYKTFSSIHTVRLYLQYLQSNGDEPFYKTNFFIGGPQSFIGLEYNQGFGTRFATARADYLIQFLTNVYLRGAVNAAPLYRIGLPKNFQTGKPLWGFGFGLIYSSIIGPIEINLTWGEKTTYQPGTYVSRFFLTAGYNL